MTDVEFDRSEEERLLDQWFKSVSFDEDVSGEEVKPDPDDPDEDSVDEDVARKMLELLSLDWKGLEEFETKAVSPGGRPIDYSPVGKPGGRQNWVDKLGGLPKYIRGVANALRRSGHSESRAIALAVAAMKRWAAGRGNVRPAVQAAAAAALAQWEAMKAAS